MNAVQTNVGAEDGEYETLDAFQAINELPPATPSRSPEYDYVSTAATPSVSNDYFESNECAAYTGTH